VTHSAEKGCLKHFGWIFVALLADLVMGVLSFTPLAWQISGGGETYPELLYAGLGLPMALIGTVAAGMIAWKAGAAPASDWWVLALRAAVVATVAICGGLTLLLWPLFPLPPGGVLEALFSVVMPALALIVLVASIALTRRRPQRAEPGRG